LNIPEGGSGTVVLTVGAKAPLAPVLPLVNADAPSGAQLAPTAIAIAMALAVVLMVVLLPVNAVFETCSIRMAQASVMVAL
jgi:hypothetical protein